MHIKTAITSVNGGEEIIRGQKLKDLIEKHTFVEAIFLLLKGELPDKNQTRMLNAMFTSAIDHGPAVASALTARVVVSAKNSMHTAIAAGILAMGDLHGGAIEGAAKFFQEQVNTLDLEALLKDLKAKKQRVLGYGHKVLEHDHRADTLFTIAKETGIYGKHCAFAEAVREQLKTISSRPLPLNIDGAMGAILMDMGFDWRMTKGVFIIARVPGLVDALRGVWQMQCL